MLASPAAAKLSAVWVAQILWEFYQSYPDAEMPSWDSVRMVPPQPGWPAFYKCGCGVMAAVQRLLHTTLRSAPLLAADCGSTHAQPTWRQLPLLPRSSLPIQVLGSDGLLGLVGPFCPACKLSPCAGSVICPAVYRQPGDLAFDTIMFEVRQ